MEQNSSRNGAYDVSYLTIPASITMPPAPLQFRGGKSQRDNNDNAYDANEEEHKNEGFHHGMGVISPKQEPCFPYLIIDTHLIETLL